jgi:hypothetical protein
MNTDPRHHEEYDSRQVEAAHRVGSRTEMEMHIFTELVGYRFS